MIIGKGFVLASLLLVLFAAMTIVSASPVFSLIFLIGSFLLASSIIIMLGCEFIALILIIVYVGAISVLFLFTIMMLESKTVNISKNAKQSFPVGICFGISFCLPLLKEIDSNFKTNNLLVDSEYLDLNWFSLLTYNTDIQTFGIVLYTSFILPVLISGMLLLLILVGVVYFLNNLKNKRIIGQSSFKQLSRNSNSLIF